MSQLLEENKANLYNFLLESNFKTSYPENCQDKYSKVIGLDIPQLSIANKKYESDFHDMGLTQWIGAQLVYFYDAIVMFETGTDKDSYTPHRHPSGHVLNEKVTDFNTFIWKISRSVSYRTKPWDIVEKNIKVAVLENIKNTMIVGLVGIDDCVIKQLDNALKVCRQENGYNGAFMDIINYYFRGLDSQIPDSITVNNASLGEGEHIRSISHTIIWSVFSELKDFLGDHISPDMACAAPRGYLTDNSMQEMFISEIRAK